MATLVRVRAVLACAAVAIGTALAAPAIASGTASPAPAPPPKVSFDGLPDGAALQPKNLDGTPHQVTARLVADVDAVEPGGTFRLGLHLTQKKDWHTYWKSNTEIGQPTEITWTGPEGLAFSSYEYPVPQRFELEGIVSFGYEKEVLLFTVVQVPGTATPGSTLDLGAAASWLACEVQCIPGHVELKLPVLVAAERTASTFAPLFDHYAAQHPTPLEQVSDVTITASVDPSPVVPAKSFKATFRVTPNNGAKLAPHTAAVPWPTFTPILDSYQWMVLGQTVKQDGDAIVIEVEGEPFEDLGIDASVIGGLFQVEVGDKWVRTELSQPLPFAGGAAAPADGASEGTPDGVAVATVKPMGTPELTPEVCEVMVPPSGLTGFTGYLMALGLAFLGGLLLNVMPCVLPVLTLKLFSLVEQAESSTSEQRWAGIAYTGGVVASFLVIALVVIVLKVLTMFGIGDDVGWGFLFQQPLYIAALAALVFVFGLSLFGVFEIPAFGADKASQAGSSGGLTGHFFTGVFTTLIATPCTAPFLGSAMGYALALPVWGIAPFFAIAGFGLGLPFLIIAFVPALFRYLPRPGAWMETMKQFVGFTMMVVTAWLVGILGTQVGLDGVVSFVWFLAFLGLGAWIFGHFGGLAATRLRQLIAGGVAVAVIALAALFIIDLSQEGAEVSHDSDLIAWKRFRGDNITTLLNRYRDGDDTLYAGRPVFLDFTASWCLSCKVFENTVLETTEVAERITKHDAVAMKADWTRQDKDITDWLKCFGTAGVPYYAVVPAEAGKPIITLGEAISQGSVLDALDAAAAPTHSSDGEADAAQ